MNKPLIVTILQILFHMTGGKSHSSVNLKIIGGKWANIEEHPHHVAVDVWDQFLLFFGHYEYKCGGVIIASSWIITAAHCVYDRGSLKVYKYFRIHAGTSYIGFWKFWERWTTVTVSKVIPHESYEPVGVHIKPHDIALLKLATPLEFSDVIKPALFSKNYEGKEEDEFYSADFSGFGVDENKDMSVYLKTFITLLVSPSTCSTIWGSRNILPSMICAGVGLQDGPTTCFGDSGGGLTVNLDNSSKILLGIMSYGPECEIRTTPSIFTRISTYTDWIVEKIKSNSHE